MGARRWRAAFSAIVGLALTFMVLSISPSVADTQPEDPAIPNEPTTVSTDVLPTVQIDGVVWDQAISGDSVYAVGKFTTARPAGAAAGVDTVPRLNILKYTLSTGELDTTFNASLNAEARVVTVSGSRVYVGGSFTKANGTPAVGLVALDAMTGAVQTGFAPNVNGTVRALAVSGSKLYLGGSFTKVRGVARARAAAVLATTGALDAFAPVIPNGVVLAMVVSRKAPNIVLGGSFTSLNGSTRPGYGLGMVDLATGRVNRTLAVNDKIRNAGSNAAIMSLKGDADGFYGSGFAYAHSPGNLEGAFRSDWNGNLVWVDDCHGDTYDVQPIGKVVYAASHKHYCGNLGTGGFPQKEPRTIKRATAMTKDPAGTTKRDIYGYPNFAPLPSTRLLTFYPDFNVGTATGQVQGPWTVEGNPDYVIYGGEFTTVNGKPQQGLVRFGSPSVAPNDDGPVNPGDSMKPTVTDGGSDDGSGSGTAAAVISWPANWDRDNATLTYRIYRGSSTTPIATKDVTAPFWNLPRVRYVDKGLTPGSTVKYRIDAMDPWDNATTKSSFTEVTLPSDTGDPGTDTFTAIAPPRIVGIGQVGRTLTLDRAATWSNLSARVIEKPNDFRTYQWLRDGDPIGGATARSYQLTYLDLGRKITLRETVADRRAFGTSESVDDIFNNIATGTIAAPVPTISGGKQVGSTLRGSAGTYPSGVTLRYQWLRDGVAIAGATRTYRTLSRSDAGHAVTLQVTASKAGFSGSARRSSARHVSAYVKGQPKFRGTTKVGKKLTRTYKGTWYAPGYKFTYRWLRNGREIPWATKSTYKLTSKDKRKRIVLRITAKKYGYPTVIRESYRSSRIK